MYADFHAWFLWFYHGINLIEIIAFQTIHL